MFLIIRCNSFILFFLLAQCSCIQPLGFYILLTYICYLLDISPSQQLDVFTLTFSVSKHSKTALYLIIHIIRHPGTVILNFLHSPLLHICKYAARHVAFPCTILGGSVLFSANPLIPLIHDFSTSITTFNSYLDTANSSIGFLLPFSRDSFFTFRS